MSAGLWDVQSCSTAGLPGLDDCRAVGFGFRRTASPRGAVCGARGSLGMQPLCSRLHGSLVPCSAGSDAVQQNVTASSTCEHLSHVNEALDPFSGLAPGGWLPPLAGRLVGLLALCCRASTMSHLNSCMAHDAFFLCVLYSSILLCDYH